MTTGAERKYIILFAILIALTGLTFESKINSVNVDQPLPKTQHTSITVATKP